MQTPEGLQSFYKRVTPAIPELFNMAHAICGNYDLAEYALQYTLMEAWASENHGGMGFREGLRNTLRRVAADEALEPRAETPEMTWNGLRGENGDEVMKQLAGESTELRRIAALRYGCGLSVGRIAKLTGLSAGRVREALSRFERRTARRLPRQEQRRVEQRLAEGVAKAFARADADMPPLGAIYRSFAAEVMEVRRPGRLISKIVRRMLCAVVILLCGVVFWLTAALMQPVRLETAHPLDTVQTD